MSSPGEGSMVSAMSMGSPGLVAPTMGSVQMGVGVPGVASPIASAGVQQQQQVPPNAAFAGIASSLRQRLEIEKEKIVSPSPSPALSIGNKRDSQSVMTRDGDGLGGRIVIEDDEELPSKIMDSSMGDTSLAESPSPEPEPVIRRLGALAVVNRTPSPASLSSGEAEGVREEDGREKQREMERSLISTASSSQTPPPPQQPQPPAPLLDLPPASPLPRSLRTPTLAELREGGLQVPGENNRKSLFLPHPNAPKAPSASSPGPMYIASQQQQEQQQQQAYAMRTGPPRQHLVEVMRMALSVPRPAIPVARAPGMMVRGPTVYGRTEVDLKGSMGPVPISFSLEPPPLPVQPPQGAVRLPPPSPSPLRSTSVPGGMYASRVVDAQKPSPERQGSLDMQLSSTGALPRPNFHPKAPGARPRSRSFSGFNSTDAEGAVPVQKRCVCSGDAVDELL
ncbi:hypothetical protein BDQ17DRAFT_1373389 [Cyathus striatus]|nr:hypothetical protein BDQ17DRAFT_1373389 [Cyathus striatus]